MYHNILGSTKSTMNGEGESACSRVLAQSGAMMLRRLDKEALDRRRRNDARWDLRSVEAEHRNVTQGSRRRHTKNAIANGYISMSISRDEASTARSTDGEGAIREEMRFLVRRSGLCTIIEVGARTIIVMMTDGIDSEFLEVAFGIEDMLEDWNVADRTWSGDCSIKEKLVNGGRSGTRATTPRRVRKLRVVDIK